MNSFRRIYEGVRVLKALEMEGSKSKAETKLKLTHHTFTKALRELRELFPLFDLYINESKGGPMLVTDKGRHLILVFNKYEKAFSDFLDETTEFGAVEESKQTLTIAGAEAIKKIILMPLLSRLNHEFGNQITPSIKRGTSWNILDSIEEGSIQIAFLGENYEGDRFESVMVGKAHLGFFAPKSWKNKGEHSFEACRDYPLATYSGGILRRASLHAIRNMQIKPNVGFEGESSEDLVNVMKQSEMVAFLPLFYEEALCTYQVLPLDEEEFPFLTVDCYCVYKRGSPFIEEIVNFLLQEIHNLELPDSFELILETS